MIPFWKESPFIQILFPFVIGILFYNHLFKIHPLHSLIILVFLFIILGIYNLQKDYFKIKFAWLQGAIIHFILFVSAIIVTSLHDIQNSKNWFGHSIKKAEYTLLQSKNIPEEKAKTYKIEVDVLQTIQASHHQKTHGEAILYLEKNEESKSIRPGDILLARNTTNRIQSTGNPGSFDYAAYCASKNQYYSSFLKKDEWKFIQTKQTTFHSIFQSLNEYSRNILSKHIENPEALGIAEALLVGYRLDIDDNIWQAYTNTGIVHIVAISGMHMALIYKSILWALLLIPFLKKRKKIPILISVLLMWLFACITGLPASVVRAASMFTIIAWGDFQDEKSSTLNMLAASAFFMLCYNPQYLIDVGFQLSFLAVLSLILFYTPIYERLIFKNKIADLLWQLISMTLAAQVFTFPICIYYFHQFPLLFLITNLIAVPLTTFILYLEILLVCFQFATSFASALGILIQQMILYLNQFVFFLSNQTFSVWSGISISLLQTILLYLVIFFFVKWLYEKYSYYLMGALLSLLVFNIFIITQTFVQYQQKKMIVYNINKQKSLEFLYQNQHENMDEEATSAKDENYTLKPAHTYFKTSKFLSPLSKRYMMNDVEFFSFFDKKIMRIEKTNFQCEENIPVDVLIISKLCEIDLDTILKQITPQKIVLDASVPFWKIEAWKQALNKQKIPFHIVGEQGAYIWNLET